MITHTREKCGYIRLELPFCLQCAVFIFKGSNLLFGVEELFVVGYCFHYHFGHTLDKFIDFPIQRHSDQSFLVQQLSDKNRFSNRLRGLGFVVSEDRQGIGMYNKQEHNDQT